MRWAPPRPRARAAKQCCAYRSGALLVGLGAGLWWADPVTALAIAAVAVEEGRDSSRGEACCTGPALIAEDARCGDDCCAPVAVGDRISARGRRRGPSARTPT